MDPTILSNWHTTRYSAILLGDPYICGKEFLVTSEVPNDWVQLIPRVPGLECLDGVLVEGHSMLTSHDDRFMSHHLLVAFQALDADLEGFLPGPPIFHHLDRNQASTFARIPRN